MTDPTRPRPVVLAHGGAGGPRTHDDGCALAAEAGAAALRENAGALEAAIRATVVLEDDPRMNAGTGSNFRLDGTTIEMDAAVMDSDLRFGGVAAIQQVKNPVRVAERVMATPHLLLAGEGATRFARAEGIPEFYPVSERARERRDRVRAFFAGNPEGRDYPGWRGVDPRAFWNFPDPVPEELLEALGPSDTVGAVARDAKGRYAAALSTGGTSIMMLGRVGDTPIIGAGLYAGPHGAVATTGDGEEIMRQVLAKRVYDWIAAGMTAKEACERSMTLYEDRFSIGVIAVGPHDEAAADTRTMPRAVAGVE